MPGLRLRAVLLFALIATAAALGGCAQDVCATKQGEDVVGCGGHWDNVYRGIEYPSSPGG
jgi:hypothetical protein